ncbi:hypothetical protein BY996DRAFT_6410988 [Phakopsora pachyrhizi]|nr:hypothetical protein BY996DRAFT_6410988 [Phakopsora pachyrhizi]
MSAHSAAATNSRVYLPTNCSASLEVLKCSESAVGFQAVCMCCKGLLQDSQVLKDETNHAVDDPQKIANSVCSASQRATKSVGIATPTYYANLVATRAKKWDISDENGSTVFTTNSGAQTSDDKLLKRHFRIQYSIPENDENDDKLNNKDGDGGD